jgi:hypothetical protein
MSFQRSPTFAPYSPLTSTPIFLELLSACSEVKPLFPHQLINMH